MQALVYLYKQPIEIIDDCIVELAQRYKVKDQEIITILLENFKDSNFIYEDYNIRVDDQFFESVGFEEQEYLHRNYSAAQKFPKYNMTSDVPPKFQHTYFAKVNQQISQNLKNNVNFNNQTLSYARNNIIGQHIINCIMRPLINKNLFGPKPKITVVDATANIGGDTLTFALEQFVGKVYAYELSKPVYHMLINNIELYGLKSKITAKNSRFDYSKDVLKDALVIIDPPYESAYNVENFNLSIDKTPIYNVAQKCLDYGAMCVMLTMPKTFKYNIKFALENDQYVAVYQMGKKNNKIFIVMRVNDSIRLHLQNFKYYKVVESGEKGNPYKCKIESDKTDSFTPQLSGVVVYNNDSLKIAQKVTKDYKTNNLQNILVNFTNKYKGQQWLIHKNADIKQYYKFIDFIPSLQDFPSSPIERPVYMDIGAGNGETLVLIGGDIGAKRKIAVDVADIRTNKNSEFILLKVFEPINMPDKSVNIVSLFHSLHHMVDAEYRLKDISRILKNNGLLFLKDHNVEANKDKDNVTFEHFVYSLGEGKATINDMQIYNQIEPMYYYSEEQVTKYLESIGFERLFIDEYRNLTKTYDAVYIKHG
jgi:ubiquinone/menaquinone biosynthesis C-methylase UbiE/16S rRNA G966 N2-methylase RsmD